jgi:hypothetical protein
MKLPGEDPTRQRPVTTDAINASFRAENRERICSRCDRKAKRFWFVIRNLQIWIQKLRLLALVTVWMTALALRNAGRKINLTKWIVGSAAKSGQK